MTGWREAQPLGSDLLGGEPDAPAPPRLVSFWVPGAPVPKARPRFSSRGGVARTYTPAKTRAYEARVADAGRAALCGAWPLQGPLKAVVRVHLPALKSGPKAHRSAPPTGRPDLDNVVKAVLDALNGVLYADDSQVVTLKAYKRRCDLGEEPGVGVLVVEFRGVLPEILLGPSRLADLAEEKRIRDEEAEDEARIEARIEAKP